MPYWQLYYHIVWATKYRQPVLDLTAEPIIHNYIRTKAIGLGATVFAINGWVDHVHIIASVPPKIALSTFIGQIKAVSSMKFNRNYSAEIPIYWQDEYSVFSLDKKRLPYYVRYVDQQKEHHRQKTEIGALERIDGESNQKVLEPSGEYNADYSNWVNEFGGEDIVYQ